MSSREDCNKVAEIATEFMLDDQTNLEQIWEVGVYLADVAIPDDFVVRVAYADMSAPHPPVAKDTIDFRMRRDGLEHVDVVYVQEEPAELL